jgi:hypothetical protein
MVSLNEIASTGAVGKIAVSGVKGSSGLSGIVVGSVIEASWASA